MIAGRAPAADATKSPEVAYRRAIRRWYPIAWVEANGEALIGTLLDATEDPAFQESVARRRFDLAAHGIATHLGTMLDSAVRNRAANVAAGAVIGYPIALVASSLIGASQVVVIPAPNAANPVLLLPFLVAWLLAGVLLVASASERVRREAILAAIAVTVITSSFWYASSGPGIAPGEVLVHFVAGSAANTAMLGIASVLALNGKPCSRPTIAFALATTIVGTLALLSQFGPGMAGQPELIWLAQARIWTAALPFAAPWALAIGVSAAAASFLTLVALRRRTSAAAVALLTLPWIAGWAVQEIVTTFVFRR